MQVVGVAAKVTVGIKHTSTFAQRRASLVALLGSIRRFYGRSLPIIVTDEGDEDVAVSQHRMQLRGQGVTVLVLAAGSGLSHGRNQIVAAAATEYVALMDDDVSFQPTTSLPTLVDALDSDSGSALAGGCYTDDSGESNCYNMNFHVDEGGSTVRVVPSVPTSGCHKVDVTHNFFVARTAVLRRFGWDARQKMMEHETFFYQLYLHRLGVMACPNVTVRHPNKLSSAGATDRNYTRNSIRFREERFAQYLCKNFPELARMTTPYAQWHCRMRVFCTPAWWAQFAFDASSCTGMQYSSTDDTSAVELPLVSRTIHSSHLFSLTLPRSRDQGQYYHVPLLVIVLTEGAHALRRQRQRATWINYVWHQAHLSRERVPWRLFYAMACPQNQNGGRPKCDHLMGDIVALKSAPDGASAVQLSIEAIRWALNAASFDAVMLTDDLSLIHIGRLWTWMVGRASNPAAPRTARTPGASHSSLRSLRGVVAGSPNRPREKANLIGADLLLGYDVCKALILRLDAMGSARSKISFGKDTTTIATLLMSMLVDFKLMPKLTLIPHFVSTYKVSPIGPSNTLHRKHDPFILRGFGAEDSQRVFRSLLMSAHCYGNLGQVIACPKVTRWKSADGLELSNHPWRDASLDDVHALALTAISNKQLLKYVRGDASTTER